MVQSRSINNPQSLVPTCSVSTSRTSFYRSRCHRSQNEGWVTEVGPPWGRRLGVGRTLAPQHVSHSFSGQVFTFSDWGGNGRSFGTRPLWSPCERGTRPPSYTLVDSVLLTLGRV